MFNIVNQQVRLTSLPLGRVPNFHPVTSRASVAVGGYPLPGPGVDPAALLSGPASQFLSPLGMTVVVRVCDYHLPSCGGRPAPGPAVLSV